MGRHVSPDSHGVAEQLVALGASLFARSLTFGRTGNLSGLDTDGTLLLTPTGVGLGELDVDSLSRIDSTGQHIAGLRPTKEAFLHQAMYRARPSARAVVHTHSTYSVAVSCMRDTNPDNAIPPLTAYYAMRVGTLPLLPYHAPGDPALGPLAELTAQKPSRTAPGQPRPDRRRQRSGIGGRRTRRARRNRQTSPPAAGPPDLTSARRRGGQIGRPLPMTTTDTSTGQTDGGARLPAHDVVAHGAAILEAVGMPADDARLVAESLVTSDMWGHPSHGMLRLPWYVARIRSGVMKPVTTPETVSTFGAVTVLDGHDGVGQIVTSRAVGLAGAAARTHGVGVVAVRNSNHFGTAAYWTRLLAEQGCVGILTTNGSPAMAPWGGKDKMVGANPWSIAVPSGFGTIVLDIANTGVARGKVYAAKERGEALPEGWAIDADGLPTTDPQAAIDGIILPMAGHKGYAISFMMDVLSGVLTGSSYSTGVVGPYVPDRRSGCGHLVIAIAIEAIMALEEFNHRMDDLIDTIKRSAATPGGEIVVPGELENRAVDRAGGTVTLPDQTLAALAELARDAGIAPLASGA